MRPLPPQPALLNMSISFSCPECSAPYRISDEYAGRSTKCKKCGATMSVPDLDDAPEEVTAEEPLEGLPPLRRSGARQQRSEPALPSAAIGACAGAAVVGVGVWAAIAIAADLEIGWLAWGIGGACGAAMSMLGARGTTAAVIAAVFAVLGIVGGKVVSAKIVLDQVATEFATDAEAREDFEAIRVIGAAVAQSEHPLTIDATHQLTAEYWEFDTSQLSASETNEVRDELLYYESLTESDGWDRYQSNCLASFHAEYGIVDFIQKSLSPIDLLFLALGVATAFGMVARER